MRSIASKIPLRQLCSRTLALSNAPMLWKGSVGRPVVTAFGVCSRRFSSLPEVLSNEIAAESADIEIDQDYLDSKKKIAKKFSISDEPGMGKQ